VGLLLLVLLLLYFKFVFKQPFFQRSFQVRLGFPKMSEGRTFGDKKVKCATLLLEFRRGAHLPS